MTNAPRTAPAIGNIAIVQVILNARQGIVPKRSIDIAVAKPSEAARRGVRQKTVTLSAA